MFDRLGGPEVRAVAERFFTEPTAENLDDYRKVCFPYYLQQPPRPDIAARITRRPEVTEYFFRGEILHFDFTDQVREIRCPVLLLAGELDPIVSITDAEELSTALPPGRVRFERFRDAAHLLEADQPDAVRALIREFVLSEP